MPEDALWIGATGAALGGVALLRLAWGRPARSLPLNFAGWGMLMVAAFAGGALAGAWGVTITSLIAMAGALAVLGHSAATAPLAAGAAAPNRRAGIAPPGEPLHLGRRFATFLITVPLAFVAAIALAIGLRALMMLAGTGEANANATALFLVPVAWGVLAYALTMQESRRTQIATLTLCALAALAGLIPGA